MFQKQNNQCSSVQENTSHRSHHHTIVPEAPTMQCQHEVVFKIDPLNSISGFQQLFTFFATSIN